VDGPQGVVALNTVKNNVCVDASSIARLESIRPAAGFLPGAGDTRNRIH